MLHWSGVTQASRPFCSTPAQPTRARRSSGSRSRSSAPSERERIDAVPVGLEPRRGRCRRRAGWTSGRRSRCRRTGRTSGRRTGGRSSRPSSRARSAAATSSVLITLARGWGTRLLAGGRSVEPIGRRPRRAETGAQGKPGTAVHRKASGVHAPAKHARRGRCRPRSGASTTRQETAMTAPHPPRSPAAALVRALAAAVALPSRRLARAQAGAGPHRLRDGAHRPVDRPARRSARSRTTCCGPSSRTPPAACRQGREAPDRADQLRRPQRHRDLRAHLREADGQRQGRPGPAALGQRRQLRRRAAGQPLRLPVPGADRAVAQADRDEAALLLLAAAAAQDDDGTRWSTCSRRTASRPWPWSTSTTCSAWRTTPR